MNDIVFVKQNGGLGRTAASEDPISGLILSHFEDFSDMLAKFEEVEFLDANGNGGNAYIAKLNYYEQLANDFGVVETPSEDFYPDAESNVFQSQIKGNILHYQVREFFRQSPSGTLYLCAVHSTVGCIEGLQRYSGGKIRQLGVVTYGEFNEAWLSELQDAATNLEADHMPLSIIASVSHPEFTPDFREDDWMHDGLRNVSLLIGCDLDPALVNSLWGEEACIGNLLGCVSAAAVNESIAWVGKFPLGLKAPGLITGELIKDLPSGDLEILNNNRLIFARTHVGVADCYFNDSHTLDLPTSDYAYIENVRTIDKATRGIRTNLLPYLNAPLYVDATTGKLRADTVAVLETVAGRALEDMEKAGELSGYKVEIDPDQNVLATSELEVIIKNVPVGVMRKVTVKIGFTTSV